jgi:hypothetical protein
MRGLGIAAFLITLGFILWLFVHYQLPGAGFTDTESQNSNNQAIEAAEEAARLLGQ